MKCKKHNIQLLKIEIDKPISSKNSFCLICQSYDMSNELFPYILKNIDLLKSGKNANFILEQLEHVYGLTKSLLKEQECL